MILINCFGGIMKTSKVVATLENAIRHKNITKPIVIRLRGNSEREALNMMDKWKEKESESILRNYPIYI